MAEEQEELSGNMGGVHRRGGVVHRATGPWTPAVHACLMFLADRLPGVPRVLGFDDEGREMLTYLAGEVIDTNCDALSDGQLVALVTWMAEFHLAMGEFHHPGPWRYFSIADATLIGHNDIAPYNVCFDGDSLTGVFDWDLAGPTTPLAELAFLAWNCVPLTRDIGAAEAAWRLTLIADAYGDHSAHDILAAVPWRIDVMLQGIPQRATAGDAGMQRLMALGEPQRSRRTLDALLARLPSIQAQL